MAGFFANFGKFGLGDLDDADFFEDKKKGEEKAKAEPPKEEDFILDKAVVCPVCEKQSSQKIMKTGKAKLLSTDVDLRPVYEFVDGAKYEVYQCEFCGYAGLAKTFAKLSPKQIKMVQEDLCSKIVFNKYEGTTYSYDQALERYQIALASAVVKKAKASEKAYICLKTAWLLRGYAAQVEADGKATEKSAEKPAVNEAENPAEKAAQIRAAEKEYLAKAYQGFSKAVTEESFPVCGMDENTIDYLLSAIAFEIGRMDISSRLLSKILQNPNAPSRVKDRARNLKDMVLEEIKKAKQTEA